MYIPHLLPAAPKGFGRGLESIAPATALTNQICPTYYATFPQLPDLWFTLHNHNTFTEFQQLHPAEQFLSSSLHNSPARPRNNLAVTETETLPTHDYRIWHSQWQCFNESRRILANICSLPSFLPQILKPWAPHHLEVWLLADYQDLCFEKQIGDDR